MKGPREKLLFVTCTYANTGIDKPDYLAVVDADPASKTYSQVVHRLAMPKVGDELHHFGWNICSSCHGKPGDRRYLIVPGLKSSRIHIVDAKDPLEPEDAQGHRAGGDREGREPLRPAHGPLPADGEIMISMLGDAKGNGPGGFLLLERQVRADRPLGEGRDGDELQLRLLVSAAAQRDGVERVGRAEDVPARPQLRRREGRQVRPAAPLLGLEGAEDSPDVDLGAAADPAGGPLPPRPGEAARLRRRGAQQHDVALRRRWQTASGRPRRSSNSHRSRTTSSPAARCRR